MKSRRRDVGAPKSAAFRVTEPSSPRSALTPMLRIKRSMVATSCKRGTLSNVKGWAVNKAAHSSGKAAFLAPEMGISPFKCRPPRMRNLSIWGFVMAVDQAWLAHSLGV